MPETWRGRRSSLPPATSAAWFISSPPAAVPGTSSRGPPWQLAVCRLRWSPSPLPSWRLLLGAPSTVALNRCAPTLCGPGRKESRIGRPPGREELDDPLKRLGPGDFSTPAPSLAAGGEFLIWLRLVASIVPSVSVDDWLACLDECRLEIREHHS